MDPYAAQWAHYGYAISAPADASATAATAAQAAYPAYYNYQQAAQAAQAGVQVTTAGNSVAHQAHHAAVKPPPPQHQRQRYVFIFLHILCLILNRFTLIFCINK